jgi:hypothetical protein
MKMIFVVKDTKWLYIKAGNTVCLRKVVVALQGSGEIKLFV